jgi:uncharacterized protein YkwD
VFSILASSLLALFVPLGSAAAIGFTDIAPTSPHADAIFYLKSKDVISGYKDGTFRPDRTLNRAEFVKILTTLFVSTDDIDTCSRRVHVRFRDVPQSSWFAPFVCAAKEAEFIDGLDDGTFHPADTLTIAEAAKILDAAFKIEVTGTDAKMWYRPYTAALAAKNAIPSDVEATGQALTRGAMAEMLYRLREKITDQPSKTGDALNAAMCDWFTDDQIPHVDMQEVRRAWFSWINDARRAENLAPYTQDKQLNKTATLWSLHAKDAGAISHKRTADAAYYDYKMIEQWFSKQYIDFANVKSTTFTENIGWGVYKCKKDDCTEDLITALRPTFDMYMNEKGKASRAHYNSIMNAQFRLIGMGVAVDSATGKIYVTTHYGTAITSDPNPVCP